MAFVYYAIILVHVLACLFLIGVVLLQQGKSQDLASAFGGGGTQTPFGPRGSANVLSRATTILAGVFIVTSLAPPKLRPHQASGIERTSGPGSAPRAAATPPPAAPPAAPARHPAP